MTATQPEGLDMTDEQITELAEPFWLKDAQKEGEFFDANGFAYAILAAAPAQSYCPSCGGNQTTWKCTCDPIWPGYAKPQTERALSEDTIKQIAQRFGAIYEDRIVFHDDKFTEFAEALVNAPQPAQTERALTDDARERYGAALLQISKYAKHSSETAAEMSRIAHKALYKAAAQPASGADHE
jgi:hypothetical protein